MRTSNPQTNSLPISEEWTHGVSLNAIISRLPLDAQYAIDTHWPRVLFRTNNKVAALTDAASEILRFVRPEWLEQDHAVAIITALAAPHAISGDQVRSALANASPQVPTQLRQRNPAFPVTRFNAIKMETDCARHLIKGLLPAAGLAVIWGPPKCGKSFLGVDMGLHVARGVPYRGRLVGQTPVVYIALEGQEGWPARIEAFRRYHKVAVEEDVPFFLVVSHLDLIKDVRVLVSEIKAQVGVSLPGAVFVDTLNRSFAGSESKDEDMAKYLASAEMLANAFDAAVVLIHHCGIDTSRPRGHSSLTASADVQLSVKRLRDGNSMLEVQFAKDMPEGARIVSRLAPVVVGVDADGEEITSLVAIPAQEDFTEGLTHAGNTAFTTLKKLLDECGEVVTGTEFVPVGAKCVSMRKWRERTTTAGISKSAKWDARRKAFVRALHELQEEQLVGTAGDFVWVK